MNLNEIALAVENLDINCSCGEPIHASEVDCYPHDGGVKIDDYTELQWVYFHCPRCEYDWALWKLLNRATRKWSRGSEIQVLKEAIA